MGLMNRLGDLLKGEEDYENEEYEGYEDEEEEEDGMTDEEATQIIEAVNCYE